MKQDASVKYIRYLTAKKNVDDRALNRHVWQALTANLPSSSSKNWIEVIDIGAGTGTMFERMMSWRFSTRLHYTMVEKVPEYLAAFKSKSHHSSSFISYALEWRSKTSADIISSEIIGTVDMCCTDLFDVIFNQKYFGQFDIIIAHAVMDLVNVNTVLDGFEKLVKPGGLLYLTLNYDGLTFFLPPFDPDFEHYLFQRYHLSMDQRIIAGRRSGSSQSGRELLTTLSRRQLPILAAGSSDWFICPSTQGYLDDDTYFLEEILQTIHNQLKCDNHIDPCRLSAWMTHRQNQLKAAELIFMARNIDILVKVLKI
jgi:2-polyprenyl-3-methyl-5-hydroxy-6-metoxy-1,4-benzoquinol methylase